MKARTWIIMLPSVWLTLALACPGGAQESDELRHRGFAGFGYREVTGEDVAAMGLPDTTGVVVTAVLPGSAAERAGLKEGDILRAFDDHPVADVSSFLGMARSYYAGDEAVFGLVRGGERLSLPMTFGASLETSEEVDVEYTSFTNREGIRLRAVVTSPLGSEPSRLPAILMVSALGSPRLIDAPRYDMRRQISHTLSKAGIRVMRFELRGYGDSEGEDFRTTDLTTEVDDNLDALDYLAGRGDVDPARVFVMGHSTAGFVAAQLAGQRELAGAIVSCTVGRTFYERMVETLRLQSELGDDSPAETDRAIADYLLLCVSMAGGEPLSSITEKHPDLSRFVNPSGRVMDDRTDAYWRQQLNLNFAEVYGAIEEPVLIVYAASDFLTQLACHEHIADVLAKAGNEDVTLTVIEDLDHNFAHAADKAASFEHYRTRAFEANPAPIARIEAWLSERTR
jgi:dienelactone hydrolase